MRSVRKHRNYQKRINYIVAVALLILFYIWLLQSAHVPADNENPELPNPRTVADAGQSGRGHTPGLVASFPDEVPVFVPSRVLTCHVADKLGEASAVLESPAGVRQVSDYYRTALPKNGWGFEEESRPGGNGAGKLLYLFRGGKSDRVLVVRLTGEESGTRIQLKVSTPTADDG